MKNKLLLVIILIITINLNAQSQTKITVAQDGTGNYKTVQEALNVIPLNNKKPILISIKNGIYKGLKREL